MISAQGVAIRLKVKDVKIAGRATKGVILMRLKEDDFVAAVARISAEDLKQIGADVDTNSPEDQQRKLQ